MSKRKRKPDPSKKNGAVIYPRVSDPRQVENTSLEFQRKECEELTRKLGAPVVGVFEERGESAKTADRTKLQEALRVCVERRNEIRYFVVYRLDRFSRYSRDFHALKHELHKLGIELRVVIGQTDDSPEGKLSETMQVALAQYENDVRALRTRNGMTENARRGRWQHRAPLGYLQGVRGDRGPSLLVDPVQGPRVRRCFLLVDQGRSVREALEEVTQDGLRTRRGRPVEYREMRKMLRRQIYMGVVSAFGITTQGDFEPLVDEDVFLRVQAALDGRSRTHSPHVLDDPELPLRRFARCAWCDTPMTGSATRKKLADGTVALHRYYRCRNRLCDGGGGDRGRVNVPKAELEGKFSAYLGSLTAPEGLVSLFAEIMRDSLRHRHRDLEAKRQRIARRRRELFDERAAITKAAIAEAIDPITSREQLDRNRDEDESLTQKEAELGRPIPAVESLIPVAERVLTDPAGLWKEARGEARTVLQRFLFPEGVPFDGDSFGTAVTSPLFSRLRAWESAKGKMVTPGGFEPPSPG